MLKEDLDDLLEKSKAQPVGWGYIDCIIKPDNVTEFVNKLTEMDIRISALTWWCDCTDKKMNHDGCPHGMGGPDSRFYDGWFSEMPWDYVRCDDFEDNTEVLNYIFSNFPQSEDYLPCLIPALWLDVPDDWRNIQC